MAEFAIQKKKGKERENKGWQNRTSISIAALLQGKTMVQVYQDWKACTWSFDSILTFKFSIMRSRVRPEFPSQNARIVLVLRIGQR